MAEHTPAPTPNRAVYGFALFLFFKTLFILYLFWAFVPESILEEKLGLTYLPDKYFALYIPILVIFALTMFGFFIYPAWNLSMQDDINDIHTINDRYTIERCRYVSANGKQCEMKVLKSDDEINGHQLNVWHCEKYCIIHKVEQKEHKRSKEQLYVGVAKNIENYCDCTDKTKCLLNKNPNHLNILYERATVPSVCDIDLVDVCKQLFRKKK